MGNVLSRIIGLVSAAMMVPGIVVGQTQPMRRSLLQPKKGQSHQNDSTAVWPRFGPNSFQYPADYRFHSEVRTNSGAHRNRLPLKDLVP